MRGNERRNGGDGHSLWFDHYRRGILYYAKNPWMEVELLYEIKKAVRDNDSFTQEEADELLRMVIPADRKIGAKS